MSAVDKYNVASAEILANSALHLPITQAAPIYEQLLSIFPTAAKYWRQYVEAQMVANNDDATRQIFSRCLLNCLHVPLWRCYIRFIRKVNDKKGVEGQEETRKAFDFMLSYVGADIASGPVWMEYIAFLKSLPASNTQEESQRMTAVRKAYQRAIVTPTQHIEQLWKDYENFENSVSRQLAKGLLSEYQPKYTSSRAVYKELKKYADEIDWNMLAVPPTDSCKDQMQWIAWKRLLAFEKGNPQRIDSASDKRIIFSYEQCLMYLYHYPDIWYDYATWHAKSGSTDAAVKVFQRALKVLPDSEVLKYAYAELEESRGAIPSAKKLYESILGCCSDYSTAHIQFIRFLRTNEGVEAARKYFLDARKSPGCTYHVYVAYALMAFCLDKDPKVAHNVFEAGMKHFMHEPLYILEYADFLSCLNDDRNIRALFERALSSLPQEESIEIWKRFTQFERTYGDLTSMLKVEQRRKEALSGISEEGGSALETSLQDLISRYSFKDLWPCSSKELDHLSRQEWLLKNIGKKGEKSALSNGSAAADKSSSATTGISTASLKIMHPDTSQMVIYDPKQHHGTTVPSNNTASNLSNPVASVVGAASNPLINPSVSMLDSGSANAFDEVLKATPPALIAFMSSLPAVEGPSPNVDIVLSICLQNDFPTCQTKKSTNLPSQRTTGPAPSTSDLSGSSKSHPIPRRQLGKRKDLDRQEEDESTTVQSQPLPRDAFRIRQMQKARGGSTSQTGSVSYGSALSGDLSGSTC
ncbi:LOW QUALITY PROTEIN: cleavage stimulation factor subunit 77-like [Hibiscus syriacus]|uniref:LOW QUALITY PROTEIN: cleavage stimulation factor subunit 77-like n=1 Tax=Hibiscus syriacus TaxID=106335 RepID=UPI001923D106|nr:LOW QUALITY PROTEIN: cleavage stimulation factor subunit 77-like [Hibiscus syriacus]